MDYPWCRAFFDLPDWIRTLKYNPIFRASEMKRLSFCCRQIYTFPPSLNHNTSLLSWTLATFQRNWTKRLLCKWCFSLFWKRIYIPLFLAHELPRDSLRTLAYLCLCCSLLSGMSYFHYKIFSWVGSLLKTSY